MSATVFSAEITPPEALADALAARGQAVLAPAGLAALAGTSVAALDGLRSSWDDLPPTPTFATAAITGVAATPAASSPAAP